MPHINDSLKNDRSVFDGSARMDSMITKYLKRWEINGAQLAVSRNDSLVYAKGYGWAEKEKQQLMQPYNILRIASVSKLITAKRCEATTKKGTHCKNTAVNNTKYCQVHQAKSPNVQQCKAKSGSRCSREMLCRLSMTMILSREIQTLKH